MTTAIKRRRGTTTQHSTFTGLEGEITIDTTKDTAVVHNGATAGGRPLLREDLANNTEVVTKTGTQTLTNKTLTSPVINTPTGITKSDISLGNVDNTSDATKNAATATLTNKTITLGANTITGTVAQFQAAVTDGDFATLSGTETLTNKAFNGSLGATTPSTIAGTTITSSALTSGRVTFASTGGLLADSANLTFDGTTLSTVGLTTTGNTILGNASTDTLNVGNGGLVKDASGNVGIGTASPTQKLSVSGGIGEFFGTSIDSQVRLTATGVANVAVGFNNSGSTNFLGAPNNTAYLSCAQAYPLVFTTNATERMRLDSSGNLGIGTTSIVTNSKLTVAINTTGATVPTDNLVAIADTQDMALGDGGGIRFGGVFTTGGLFNADMTYIKAYKENATSGNYSYAMTFGTRANGSNPAERMRLDSSGNLGLGVTPSAWYTAGGTKALQIGNRASIFSFSSTTTDLANNVYQSAAGDYAYLQTAAASFYRQSTGSHQWYNAPSGTAGNPITFTQAMTLDASGNLLVGTTSASPKAGIQMLNNTGSWDIRIDHVSGIPSGNWFHEFSYNSTTIGSITQNGTTGVLYNLTSDYRLKDNPEVLTGSKDFIMALQPKTWDWWDGSGKGVGFIAHEFMEVAKYSGNGEKDATEEQEYEISPAIPAVLDEEGNEVTPAVEAIMGTRTVPLYQSIQPSSSEVMANIVAFIQEQQAMIDELKAKVAALEAA